MPSPDPALPSLSDIAFWSHPSSERATAFAVLRRTEPISFQRRAASEGASQPSGFWAVTRHADVQHVSRTPDVFCSGRGVGLGEAPIEVLELNASFLVMDAPRHTELRRVVSSSFTPRQVARLEAGIAARAEQIVDKLVERGSGDVVADFAMKLPLWTISNLLGVPESMRAELYTAAEGQIASQDPEYAARGGNSASLAIESGRTMHRLAGELVAARRDEPGDDILSTLVHSEFEGEPLSDQMLGGLFVLFATAGNDTTRQSTSHAVKLFGYRGHWRRSRE